MPIKLLLAEELVESISYLQLELGQPKSTVYMKSVEIIRNAGNQALFLLKSNNSPSGKINDVDNSRNSYGNMRLIIFCMLSTDELEYCSNLVSSGISLNFFLTLVW